MKDVLSYDGNLEMFCEAPKGINVAYLRFLRWLIEQGRLRPGEVTTRVVGWEDAPRAYLEPAIKLIVRRA